MTYFYNFQIFSNLFFSIFLMIGRYLYFGYFFGYPISFLYRLYIGGKGEGAIVCFSAFLQKEKNKKFEVSKYFHIFAL